MARVRRLVRQPVRRHREASTTCRSAPPDDEIAARIDAHEFARRRRGRDAGARHPDPGRLVAVLDRRQLRRRVHGRGVLTSSRPASKGPGVGPHGWEERPLRRPRPRSGRPAAGDRGIVTKRKAGTARAHRRAGPDRARWRSGCRRWSGCRRRGLGCAGGGSAWRSGGRGRAGHRRRTGDRRRAGSVQSARPTGRGRARWRPGSTCRRPGSPCLTWWRDEPRPAGRSFDLELTIAGLVVAVLLAVVLAVTEAFLAPLHVSASASPAPARATSGPARAGPGAGDQPAARLVRVRDDRPAVRGAAARRAPGASCGSSPPAAPPKATCSSPTTTGSGC